MKKIQKEDNSKHSEKDHLKKNNYNVLNNNSVIKEKDKIEKLNSTDEHVDNKKTIFNTSLNIRVELGTSKIKIKDLLNFSKGSIFFLNRKKEDPLKIFINSKLIALGEIVVSGDQYGIRIISINNSLNSINTSI